VSKQNLNSSSGIWHTKNCQKQIKVEKVTAPQSRGGQELKKHKTANATKPVPEHPKHASCVALLLLKFKDDL
jgi:hypothetical protein